MEAATNTWAKHINHKESDAFSKRVNTFGNPQWTKRYLILIAVVLTIVFIIVLAVNQIFVVIEAIICVFMFICFVGLLVLVRRLSAVKDEILLRREFVYFALLGLVYGVEYAVLFLVSHDFGESDPIPVEVLYDALYMIIPSPILYCMILLQTQWVLYQYNHYHLAQKQPSLAPGDLAKKANGKKASSVDDANVTLRDIMSDFEGYKVFMEYLVKCVSAENLLFVSEVVQFMRDVAKKHGIKPSTVQLQTYYQQYEIPKILPTSAIMSGIDATSIRFLRLCEKYILEGSEFEINISHKSRKSLVDIYRSIEEKINVMNPKIVKLSNFFGDTSELFASRRASQSLYGHGGNSQSRPKVRATPKPSEDDIKSDEELEGDGEEVEEAGGTVKRRGHHAQSSSHKISHDNLDDFQLLSTTNDTLQQIFDCLCWSLGDVYTNLNDGCLRFMNTEVYYRWYAKWASQGKKESVLQEGDEDEAESTDEEEAKELEVADTAKKDEVAKQQEEEKGVEEEKKEENVDEADEYEEISVNVDGLEVEKKDDLNVNEEVKLEQEQEQEQEEQEDHAPDIAEADDVMPMQQGQEEEDDSGAAMSVSDQERTPMKKPEST